MRAIVLSCALLLLPSLSDVVMHLGFGQGDIAGVDLRCTGGLFSYYCRDPDTALTALD